jgi:hypothetical protein
MVHVTNRAHVDVGLGPLEFAFCHFISPDKEQCQWLVLGFRSGVVPSATGSRRRPNEDRK